MSFEAYFHFSTKNFHFKKNLLYSALKRYLDKVKAGKEPTKPSLFTYDRCANAYKTHASVTAKKSTDLHHENLHDDFFGYDCKICIPCVELKSEPTNLVTPTPVPTELKAIASQPTPFATDSLAHPTVTPAPTTRSSSTRKRQHVTLPINPFSGKSKRPGPKVGKMYRPRECGRKIPGGICTALVGLGKRHVCGKKASACSGLDALHRSGCADQAAQCTKKGQTGGFIHNSLKTV